MASQTNPNLASQVIKFTAQRVRTLAQQTAARIGRPIDAQAPTKTEQARLWHLQNPQADPALVRIGPSGALEGALVDAGQHKQAVDMMWPWRSKLYGSGTPADRVTKAEQISSMAGRNMQAEQNMTTDAGVPY